MLRRKVRGRYSRVYCGRGSRARCRDALLASLGEAIKVAPAEVYGGDAVCAKDGRDGDQACYDAIFFRPLGGITQPLDPLAEPADVPAGRRGGGRARSVTRGGGPRAQHPGAANRQWSYAPSTASSRCTPDGDRARCARRSAAPRPPRRPRPAPAPASSALCRPSTYSAGSPPSAEPARDQRAQPGDADGDARLARGVVDAGGQPALRRRRSPSSATAMTAGLNRPDADHADHHAGQDRGPRRVDAARASSAPCRRPTARGRPRPARPAGRRAR